MTIRNFVLKAFILFSFSMLAFSCGEDCEFNGITNENLKDAVIGEEYSDQIYYDISCSFTAKNFSIISGSLPNGILMGGDGIFSGTPEDGTEGDYKITVLANICFGSGAYGATDCVEKSKELTLTVKKD